ncbi:MAG: hypothetical protein KAT17_05345, partial [Candidatus Aminicenantes bacterium]|nr:hypothetical protein [Candidatus Aminicenantes bacterium]
ILSIVIFFVLIQNNSYADFKYGAFDPAFWNGLLIVKDNTSFAFRFAIHKDNKVADGYDTFYLVEKVGPFAPDGSYAEINFNPHLPFNQDNKTQILKKTTPLSDLVRIRYSKFNQGIVGCINIPEKIQIEIIWYTPWGETIDYCREGDALVATKGNIKFYFFPVTSSLQNLQKKDKTLRGLVVDNLKAFYFFAGFTGSKISGNTIENVLNKQYTNYHKKRPKIIGEWEGIISSISNNLFWMKLYQPDFRRIYLPAGRRWIFPKPDGKRDLWTIFEWDAFFNALEAVVEDPSLAKSEIEAVLNTQYPTGNIPNWRSAHGGTPDRSQPPVGSFAVLKTFFRCQDLSILSQSYEHLKKWHKYWTAPGITGNPRRDGNWDGLLEWGSDTDKLFKGMPKWEQGAPGRQRAAWESGQDDLPNFDKVPFNNKTNTLTMNCLDLSSLYALDCECLRKIALLLGKNEDAKIFHEEYKTIKTKIAKILWSKDFFYDRYWDGEFSCHKAASNFYPMIAGIPNKKQIKKMVRHLLSKKEFWGDFVIPTISRDNPAFKDQQYWRGTIWPPTNYLVYQGLKRYKLDKIASQFAIKSASLFLKSWKNFGLCRENYHSISGEGGGQRYQSWGPLFALILLEDFIDISPFDGFRVGNLAAKSKNTIQNIRIQNQIYTLVTDDKTFTLYQENIKFFAFEGKAVLRHINIKPESIEFEAHVIEDSINFFPFLFASKSFKVKSTGKRAKKKDSYVCIPKGICKVVLKEE